VGNLEDLVHDNACVHDFQRNLAEVLVQIASLQRESSHYSKSRADLQRACEICIMLLVDNPGVTQSRVILARSYHEIGLMETAHGNQAAARQASQSARSIWEALIADHPDIPRFRRALSLIAR
jgi:hypothetical protein